MLVSWKRQKFSFGKGEKIAILAAMLFGLAFVNDAYLTKQLDVGFYMMIAFLAPSIFQTIIFPKKIVKMKPFLQPSFLKKLLLLGVLYALSAVTIFLSYQVGGNASKIAVLNQTVTIVTVLLAVFFLKETTNLSKKILGAILSFLGVVLVK